MKIKYDGVQDFPKALNRKPRYQWTVIETDILALKGITFTTETRSKSEVIHELIVMYNLRKNFKKGK